MERRGAGDRSERRSLTLPDARLELDHVLIAVTDLGAAARAYLDNHGLMGVEGGRHPGWGTANVIVPLRGSYLELIAVVDEHEAAATAFGRWVMNAQRDRPFAWAVRASNLDSVAARLGLETLDGSRARPDGSVLRWRSAGLDVAVAEPALPFFIEWSAPTLHPGGDDKVDLALDQLFVEGDPARIKAWLGDHTLPVSIWPGSSRVAGATLRDGDRIVTL